MMLLSIFSMIPAGTPIENVISYWNFDLIEQGKAKEEIAGILSPVGGNYRLVHGVRGQALVFDGYTSRLVFPAEKAPQLGTDFTISAWIALGAYPWNWAPIVAQENTVSLNSNLDNNCWPEDIVVNSEFKGFYFGVSPEGYLGLMVGTDKGWITCRSESKLPLRKWVKVVAIFRNQTELELYINEESVAKKTGPYSFLQAKEEPLLIGMNREKREPAYPVRPFATLASWYSFDGLIDEIKIFNDALSVEKITSSFRTELPKSEPELPLRIMPSGSDSKGKFGAYYTTLNYYPEWDRLWPVAKDADIVVQFDNSPVRIVFWRGTRYSPVWVMDKMHWMGDQSIENVTRQDGCQEHMQDSRCQFSHVRIIENTEARVVIHWRYSPVAANGSRSQVDHISEWEDWVDEYYTFYPDQLGVRKVILHTKGRALGPQEVIVFCHPGQKPEDVVDLNALTLMNMNGQHQSYDWSAGPPKVVNAQGKYLHFGDSPQEKPNILMINMKSYYKPFEIFETNNRVRIYSAEYREEISHFPWWNHWPVAQIHSDGRYCQASDHASHFSLAWAGPPAHRGEADSFWWAWLYGATNKPIETLLPIAYSWVNPPEIKIISTGYKNSGYDLTQRAYIISKMGEESETLELELVPGANSTVYNPVFLIENWGSSKFSVKINGKDALNDKYRVGYIERLGKTDVVIWVKHENESKLKISIVPEKNRKIFSDNNQNRIG